MDAAMLPVSGRRSPHTGRPGAHRPESSQVEVTIQLNFPVRRPTAEAEKRALSVRRSGRSMVADSAPVVPPARVDVSDGRPLAVALAHTKRRGPWKMIRHSERPGREVRTREAQSPRVRSDTTRSVPYWRTVADARSRGEPGLSALSSVACAAGATASARSATRPGRAFFTCAGGRRKSAGRAA